MRYYEFALYEAEENPIATKLAAIVGQISANIKDTGAEKPLSVDALLKLLADDDIELSRKDLESMLDKPPLSNLIANIQGDNVIFLDPDNDDQGDATDPDKSSETLKQMATQAANQPDKIRTK